MKPGEFITADDHFGHEKVIIYSKRPFKSADHMDAELIKRWNAKVPPGSVVYHLGDFALARPERIHRILDQLNGSIRLVRGNHDKAIRGQEMISRFEWVKDYYESETPDGIKVVMMHYAMLTWNKSHFGAWQLHGHSHNSLQDVGIRRLDIGVDTNPNYEPWSYEEIERKMRNRTFKAVDHHEEK